MRVLLSSLPDVTVISSESKTQALTDAVAEVQIILMQKQKQVHWDFRASRAAFKTTYF